MNRLPLPAGCALIVSTLLALLWDDHRAATIGMIFSLPLVAGGQALLARTLHGPWDRFAVAFLGVFCSHVAAGLALLLLCRAGAISVLPALSTWAAGVFAGTLATGLTLSWKEPSGAGDVR